jgi:alpha-beta hydrolase superfamily lysophospholipase
VIFQHGITRNRTDIFAIASTFAAAGFVTVAIDLPLHGLPSSNPFYKNKLASQYGSGWFNDQQ